MDIEPVAAEFEVKARSPEEAQRVLAAYRFCAGYVLPDDTTLSDVLGALELAACALSETPFGADAEHCRALLSQFKKED